MQWSLAAVTPANQKMCFDSVIPLPWIFSQTITVERTATYMKAFAAALFICNDEKEKKKKDKQPPCPAFGNGRSVKLTSQYSNDRILSVFALPPGFDPPTCKSQPHF